MAPPPASHRLDAASIVVTLERLCARIGERFPAAHLGAVCGELVATGRNTARSVSQMARPILWLRVLTALIVLAWLGGTGFVLAEVDWIEIGCDTAPATAPTMANGMATTKSGTPMP